MDSTTHRAQNEALIDPEVRSSVSNPNPSVRSYATEIRDSDEQATSRDIKMDEPDQSTTTHPEQLEYTIDVYCLFTGLRTFTVCRGAQSESPALDFMKHGFIVKTLTWPRVGVSVKTLLVLYHLRQRKASLSVESYARTMCDLYDVSDFVSFLPQILSIYTFFNRFLGVASCATSLQIRSSCSCASGASWIALC